MLSYLIQLKRIKTQEQLIQVVQNARNDGHEPIAPTHFIEKEGKIVGYFSLQNPTIYTWMSSELHARDSFDAFSLMECLTAERGNSEIIAPCKLTSPYYKFMEKVGYVRVMKEMDIFSKKL